MYLKKIHNKFRWLPEEESIEILFIGSLRTESGAILDALSSCGFSIHPHFTQQAEEFPKMLKKDCWDLILIDHDHQNINLTTLLSAKNEFCTGIPAILTGTEISPGDLEFALNNGIEDCCLKSELFRLVPAVKREVKNYRIRKHHQRISDKTEIQSLILQNSLNEVYLIDIENMTFSYANQAMLKNLGFTEEELYNKHVSEILSDTSPDEAQEVIRPLLKGEKKKVKTRVIRQRKDGSTYPAEIHLQKIRLNGKESFLGICFDITQQVKDAQTIEEKERQAKQLDMENRHKSELLATLSHEMRTTLNSVVLLSKILAENRNENLNEEQLDYIELIYSSNKNLLKLLNEILHFSKVDSEDLELEFELFDVQDFGEEMERLFKPIAREKNLNFQFLNKLKGSNYIYTDRLRVEQILNNLISNALKFTDEGHIFLQIYQPNTKELQEEKLEIESPLAFQVVDTGIGIHKDKQDLIFETYKQENGSSTERKNGGTGLGLAICNKLAALLGGKIKLDSTPGSGSTFTVYLPKGNGKKIQTSDDLHPKQETAESDFDDAIEGDEKRGKVLLVDDSSIHNMALTEYLEFKIDKCYGAESAQEAYQLLEQYPVDCIVLDMYLPDADGKEVLQYLSSHTDYRDIPVIIYSGKSIGESEKNDIEQYAEAVIQKKGMSYNVLADKIISLINQKETTLNS